MSKKEYKSISAKAKQLLNQQEGYDVEFKQSMSSLETSDLVAFANSNKGGTILIGIKEIKGEDGRQKTEIVGCPMGDSEKRKILDIAASCVPPVKVEVIVENLNYIPFFRVEIPSGKEKPYCTSGGVYKIRGDGRKKALLPGYLLDMFVERESESFINRFKQATGELNCNLEQVVSKMNSLLKKVREMEFNIDSSLENIYDSAANAESLSDDAMSFSDETLSIAHEIDRKIDNLEYAAILLENILKTIKNGTRT